ncbi:hypothetical protein M422DRAFT_158736, partial [Sphaerobolus stellatus SS14]
MVYILTDSEIMMEVMDGAPSSWTTIIDPHRCSDLVDFASALKYHETDLLKSQVGRNERTYPDNKRPFYSRANLIGYSSNLPSPPFPKDDSNISKGKTPEEKGARACRHCGSGKHWDNDCRHARSGARKVRAQFISMTDEDRQAMDEYEELY